MTHSELTVDVQTGEIVTREMTADEIAALPIEEAVPE